MKKYNIDLDKMGIKDFRKFLSKNIKLLNKEIKGLSALEPNSKNGKSLILKVQLRKLLKELNN